MNGWELFVFAIVFIVGVMLAFTAGFDIGSEHYLWEEFVRRRR